MKRDKRKKTSRFTIFNIFVCLSFMLLTIRLGYIQIVKGSSYKEQAERQRVNEIALEPLRGIIYDRNKIPLTNCEKEDICIVIKEILSKDKNVYNYIKDVCELSSGELEDIINRKNSNIIKIPIKKETKLKKPNSIILSQEVIRYDPNNLLAHVIGYVRKSDNIGVSGLEQAQNDLLTANESYQSIKFIVDGKKKMIPGLGYQKVDKTIGKITNSIQLTIDKSIQQVVEKIMDEKQMDGAIIVADVDSGDILAMASRPNFDQANVRAKSSNASMAFFNKCIRVGYPPASLFKTVVLLTALENDMVSFDEIFTCDGVQKIGNTEIKCHTHKDGGHGEINIEEAFYDSCNCAFIQLGQRLGGQLIIDTAIRLGFGQKVNIGLSAEEIEGILPKNNELLGPAIGNISIGQGKIEVTPLQITNMMLTIANNGLQKDMSLLKALVLEDGSVVKYIPREADKRIFDEEYALIIKDLMKKVITDGTAKEYISLNAGGKTGTAQAPLNGKKINHAWFSGFYDFENPKYVVTVLFENRTSGGKYAGTVFQEVIKAIEAIER